MKDKKRLVAWLALLLVAAMLLGLILGAIPTSVSAASSSEIQNQIDQLEGQKDALQSQINDLKAQQNANATEIKDIVKQKNLIDQQISLMYEQIRNINEQIAAYSVLIADKQEELDKAEKQLQELSELNRERIRAMEEDGELSYWSVIFEANTFMDLLDRWNMIQEIAAADERRLDELSAAAKAVAEAKETMHAEKLQLQDSKEELSVLEAELAVKSQDAQLLLDSLIQKGEEYEAAMDEAEDRQESLMNQLAQAEKDYDEAKRLEWLAHLATATTATTAPPTTAPPATTAPPETTPPSDSGSSGGSNVDELPDTPPMTEHWAVPCQYAYVSSPFGMRWHPTKFIWAMHSGVDLAGGGIKGKPIYASRAGVVTVAAWDDSAGWYVEIDHLDGYKSVYFHMTNYIVAKGDLVTQGQTIGYVGSTGASTGPHLHFGISWKGEYVNPLPYIT